MTHAPRPAPAPAKIALRLLVALVALTALASACSDDDQAGSTTTVEQAGAVSTDPNTGQTIVEQGPTTLPPLQEAPAPPTGWNIDTALAADPGCTPLTSDNPIRIGYAGLDDTGADHDIRVAIAHFANLINCSGGLDGQAVEVSYENIAGSAVDTRNAMRNLVQDADGNPKIDLLFGPPESDPGLRVLVVTASKYPVLFIGATEPGLADIGEFSYLVGFDDTAGATAAAQFARDQGWARAATMAAPGPYYGYNAQVFTDAFVTAGGQMVAPLEFDPDSTVDFSSQVTQLAADTPDVVYSSMSSAQVVQLKEQLAAAGVTTNLLLSDSFEKTLGYTQPSEQTEGIYHVTHEFPAADSRVAQLYQSMTNASTPASSFSLPSLVGDAFAVIADAYQRADRSNPDVPLAQSLGLTIADANAVVGVTGVLSYNGSGTPTKPIYIHQVVGGQPQLAGTSGL